MKGIVGKCSAGKGRKGGVMGRIHLGGKVVKTEGLE